MVEFHAHASEMFDSLGYRQDLGQRICSLLLSGREFKLLSHNLISSDQQASMTSQLRGCATVPLCIVPLCTCHCAHATVCACHALHPCNVCMLHMRAVHCIHAMHACCGGNPFPTLSLQLSDNMSHQIKRQCLSHVQAELQADSDMPRALQHC